jgi:hypothetical protein
MKYELTIRRKPGYLHAVVTGRNSRENVVRYVEEVMRECAARRCRRALIEERLEGPRLGTLDVFDLVSQGSNRFRGKLAAVAFVDVNRQGDLMDFAETVAANRAFPLKVFATVDDAERWLLDEERGTSGPDVQGNAGEPRR